MKLNEKTISNILLVIVTMIIASTILGMLFLGETYVESKGITENNSTFDLSAISPDNNETYYLEGNWDFYYGQLLITDNIKGKDMTSIQVPSSWSGTPIMDTNFKSGGYASYRAKIKNCKAFEAITIYVPNLAGAYSVFVNGQLVSKSGTFSKDSGKVFATPTVDTNPIFLLPDQTYEIVIEVAAESYSGLYLTPLLTNYEHNTNYTTTMLGFRYALVGIVFFCGAAVIFLKSLGNKNIYTLWLPILCFLLCLRMLVSNESYAISQNFLFNLSYETMNIIIYASTFIIKLVALMFLKEALDLNISKKSILLLSSLSLVLIVVANIAPNSLYITYYFAMFQLFSCIIDLYTLDKLCGCISKKVPNSEIYTLAYMFITVGIMVDAFYTSGLIPFRCSSFMPICFFVFVLSVTIVHTKRTTELYHETLETEKLYAELQRANMSIMLSQIQPHFLYNALNTIKSLIKRDPKAAEKAIIDFSYYLRGNMDSLSKKEPIPFSLELDHIKHYCEIELLRFSDKMDIIYDIGPSSFLVPTLSVQPLVENAIKHGVTKNPKGGTVKISTYEDIDFNYIKIEDDGVGFDMEATKEDDGRSHIGLSTTKARLKSIMNAEIFIDSHINKGTVIIVQIPKKSAKPADVKETIKLFKHKSKKERNIDI
ncbi:MAG: histidine kinase [Oscillospiraceae bacterium]